MLPPCPRSRRLAGGVRQQTGEDLVGQQAPLRVEARTATDVLEQTLLTGPLECRRQGRLLRQGRVDALAQT